MAGRPKGLPKTGGRQKGTPNRVTSAVRDAILAAFQKVGGEDYLVKVAREDPRTFCTLLARILPRDVSIDVPGDQPTTIADIALRASERRRAREAEARAAIESGV